MNACSNLKRWGSESRSNFPIHQEFLNNFAYWTSDKVVLSKRPKQKATWTGKDALKAKKCQDIINGIGAAGDAFKEGAPVALSDDIEMTFASDVSETAVPVYNV